MRHHYCYWSLGSRPWLPIELRALDRTCDDLRDGCEVVKPHIHHWSSPGYVEHSIVCAEPMEPSGTKSTPWWGEDICRQLLGRRLQIELADRENRGEVVRVESAGSREAWVKAQ